MQRIRKEKFLNILLVEDDIDLRALIKDFLLKEKFSVYEAGNLYDAEKHLENVSFSCAILDWMLPDGDGASFCSELKIYPDLKILMLTAKSSCNDEFYALSAGADDFLRKPFDPRILMLRINKLIKKNDIIKVGTFTVDTLAQKVYKANVCLELTKKEWQLFDYLARNHKKIFSREQLFNVLWGLESNADMRTVDTHIKRLRNKIGDDYIVTRRGLGYSLEVNDA